MAKQAIRDCSFLLVQLCSSARLLIELVIWTSLSGSKLSSLLQESIWIPRKVHELR